MTAFERTETLELALAQFREYQNRLVALLVSGFVTGFIVGLAAAWIMVHY